MNTVISKDTPVAFIGTGVMGFSMASRLIEAGYSLSVYNRSKDKASPLLEKGAVWCDSPKEAAAAAKVICTIVGFPSDVEEVYLGENGVLAGACEGSIFIDMTTSRPDLAKTINEESFKRSCTSLDAPVSGGDTGAKNGTLSIMVGGQKSAFDYVMPLLGCMGSKIVYQGGPGAGQHCKMCNQITIASNMIGVCESLLYAKKAGLDPHTVLDSISSGAAGSWSLSNLAPRILNNDFDPGFFVKHFTKDMLIAYESAVSMGLKTPGLKLALSLYKELEEMGYGDDGTQGLFRLFDRENF